MLELRPAFFMPAANRQKYTCSQCNREFAAPPFAKLVATFSCYDDDDNLMGEDVADDEPAFVCSPECRKNLTEEFAVACVATFEEHKKRGRSSLAPSAKSPI